MHLSWSGVRQESRRWGGAELAGWGRRIQGICKRA